jgi:phage-related protein
VFGKAIEVIGELAAEIIPWVIDEFAKITAWLDENGPLIEDFIKTVSDAVVFLLDKVGGLWKIVQPILSGVVDGVLGIAKVIMQVATGDWAGALETMKETAGKTWEHIKGAFEGAVDFILSFLDTNWEEVSSTWQSNWEMLKIIVDEYFLQPLQDAIDSVTEIIGGVVQDVQNLVKTFEDLTGIKLPNWLTPGSPTPFELGLRGIAEAIKSMPNLAASLTGGLTVPQLAPAAVGATAGGNSLGGGDAPVVNFYGPVTIPDVTDAPSFLEALTKMADGR